MHLDNKRRIDDYLLPVLQVRKTIANNEQRLTINTGLIISRVTEVDLQVLLDY